MEVFLLDLAKRAKQLAIPKLLPAFEPALQFGQKFCPILRPQRTAGMYHGDLLCGGKGRISDYPLNCGPAGILF
jgi:hypothetical protein